VTLSDRAASERISASYSGLIAAVRGLPSSRLASRATGRTREGAEYRAPVGQRWPSFIAGLLRHRALPVALVPYPTDPEADDQGCAAARRWRGDRSRRRPEWFVGADRLEESRV